MQSTSAHNKHSECRPTDRISRQAQSLGRSALAGPSFVSTRPSSSRPCNPFHQPTSKRPRHVQTHSQERTKCRRGFALHVKTQRNGAGLFRPVHRHRPGSRLECGAQPRLFGLGGAHRERGALFELVGGVRGDGDHSAQLLL